MPDNKNQHFVPQFYLRNFSIDVHRRSIALVNLARGNYVPAASIKSQCSRDYWHGDPDPEFEGYVTSIEGIGAAAIKHTVLSERVHQIRTLKKLVMFQLGRTAFVAEAYA